MLWIIAKSGKLEKKKVRRNLVGARSLEGLGTSGRLGLKGLLLFMYPNYIFCYGCDFNWFRLVTNSVYSLCSFSAHLVFVIKLELVVL